METINEVKEAISDVENKKFSDFSKKVKTSLEDKLRNNPTIKAKGDELKKLQNMKDTFAKISEPKTEPKKEEKPAAPAEEKPAEPAAPAAPVETPPAEPAIPTED